ncbi:LLM class flavin-dependent oxidoreductase [Mycetocola sp. JXN-3]|uniref:LLM class flavin-dependent oxidoreductase n=1 Tax=Mycetocola sp. JXN-3 TaxID=2116510 RepID=UPI00165D1BAD|nr:LLM class flavin-dependent oxidoreductase [Mycetocola sp. JXN-3]
MSTADFPVSRRPEPNEIAGFGTTAPLGSTVIGERLRVGFITHLDQNTDTATIYRENILLFQELEKLGYDSAWIATRHFHSGWAALPSPYAFLGAAAVATSKIGLGTAVLPIVLDDPIRVAEDVAVIDHLSGGRLILGVGKGVPSDSFHVFNAWEKDRDANFEHKIDSLHWALEGSQVPEGSAHIWPANAGLTGRVVHGSSNINTIRAAAVRGDGFILERFGNGGERTAEARAGFQQRQAYSVREYRRVFHETWGDTRTPYVVTSRTAYPGATNAAALAEAGERAGRWNEFAAKIGRVDLTASIPDQLLSDNFIWGTPEELAADLLADPTIALTDELILGIHPALHTLEETVEKARILLEEAYPLIQAGWAAQREAALAEAIRPFTPEQIRAEQERFAHERSGTVLAGTTDATAAAPSTDAVTPAYPAVSAPDAADSALPTTQERISTHV